MTKMLWTSNASSKNKKDPTKGLRELLEEEWTYSTEVFGGYVKKSQREKSIEQRDRRKSLDIFERVCSDGDGPRDDELLLNGSILITNLLDPAVDGGVGILE
ncbi:hypothetical protein Taro_036806 [Colocasia esculenta]|uniref:Uncharacterized protein n=1 Tax=Colocasia esculenta TaxID=4460 RepID=A0A843W9F0_COLES|nr:hypothetical protein [Colocasia esculenta]